MTRSVFSYLFVLVFGTPSNSAFSQIVGADFEFYVVALYNSDLIKAELTRYIRRNDVPVCELNLKRCVWQALNNLAFRLDNVVFGH